MKFLNHKLIILTVFLLPNIAFSALMSSENYKIGTGSMGPGVFGAQSSENYILEYLWQNTEAQSSSSDSNKSSSSSSQGGGGGIIVDDFAVNPKHVNAFNTPLILNKDQSGTLLYNFENNTSSVIEVPKNISSNGVKFFVIAEEKSDNNEYLIPDEYILVSDMFWNIIAKNLDGDLLKNFNTSIKITFNIKDEIIKNSKNAVYWFDENKKRWILVPNLIFTDNSVSFFVDHLTKFAIFESKTKEDEFINNIFLKNIIYKNEENNLSKNENEAGVIFAEMIDTEGDKKLELITNNGVFELKDDENVYNVENNEVDTKKDINNSKYLFSVFLITIAVIVLFIIFRKDIKNLYK